MQNDDESPEPVAGPGAQRPFDELPRVSYRGPLIFGVVAATLEIGVLLWIVGC